MKSKNNNPHNSPTDRVNEVKSVNSSFTLGQKENKDTNSKQRNYYKEENKRLRKEVEKLKNYIQGMKDIAYLSASRK